MLFVVYLASGVGAAAAAVLVGIWILASIVGFILYFVPTIIAFARNKSNKVPILVLNFFLGWSLIGWVVALVWALSQEQAPVVIQQTFNHPAAPAATLPEPRNDV